MHRRRDAWWQAAIRVIVSISAPEQGWDVVGASFSTIGEPGSWAVRAEQLAELDAQGILAESEPGKYAHYAHQRHLAGQTVTGRAARAMCGTFFVPRQDHESRPVCPDCRHRLEELPSR